MGTMVSHKFLFVSDNRRAMVVPNKLHMWACVGGLVRYTIQGLIMKGTIGPRSKVLCF